MKQLSDKTIELEASDAKGGSMANLIAKVKEEVGDSAKVVTRADDDGPLATKLKGKTSRKRVFVTTDVNDEKIPKSQRAASPEVQESAQKIAAKLLG